MSRRTFKIAPKEVKQSELSQEEKVNDVLSSLNTIQTQQNIVASRSPKSTPMLPIIMGIVIIGIIIVGFLGISGLIGPSMNGNLSTGTISSSLNFQIELLNGTQVSLSDYEGNPIILDFMTTWCEPCKDQIVHLKTLKSYYPSVQIISISVDLNSDSLEKLSRYAADNSMTWTVGRDITQKGAQIYNALSIPTVGYINSEGKLKQLEVGVQPFETLYSWINGS
jgi:cytochrome c biogenesis protein CcmG/thiol:disulfide interchange protein DsbE